MEPGNVVFVDSLNKPGLVISLSCPHEEDATYDVFQVLVGGKIRNVYRFMLRLIQ
jgi:hypothetical protein